MCVPGDWCVVQSYCFFYTEFKSRDSEIQKPTRSGPIRGPLQLLLCAFVLRSLPPAAQPASPLAPALATARGMLGRVLYAAASFLFLISAATAGGRTTVQTISAVRREDTANDPNS